MMLRPPKGGSWLTPDEVVDRLRGEFARVEATPGSVADFAAKCADRYRRDGHPELADRLRATKDAGIAVAVVDPALPKPMVLIVLPEFPIPVGFATVEQWNEMKPFLHRCARALGYESVAPKRE